MATYKLYNLFQPRVDTVEPLSKSSLLTGIRMKTPERKTKMIKVKDERSGTDSKLEEEWTNAVSQFKLIINRKSSTQQSVESLHIATVEPPPKPTVSRNKDQAPLVRVKSVFHLCKPSQNRPKMAA